MKKAKKKMSAPIAARKVGEATRALFEAFGKANTIYLLRELIKEVQRTKEKV